MVLGDGQKLKLSRDAEEWLENLLSVDAVDATGEQCGVVEGGEIAFGVRRMLEEAEKFELVDGAMTQEQKSTAWTLVWAIVNRTGLLQLPAGYALDDRHLYLRAAAKEQPVITFLSQNYVSQIFKNLYIAICIMLQYGTQA